MRTLPKLITFTASLAICAATIYLTTHTREVTDWHTFTYIQWWLFTNLIIAITPCSIALARFLLCKQQSALYQRFRTLCQVAAFLLGFCPALYITYGAVYGRYDYRVERISLPIHNLPPSFNGYRIVLISDSHVGSLNGDTTKLSAAIDSINACNPDMVLFLGDFVNCFAEEADDFLPLMNRIKATHKYAVMGNHDLSWEYHQWNSDALNDNISRTAQAYNDAGFTLLTNQWRFITNGPDSILLGSSRDSFYEWATDTTTINHNHFCKIVMAHSPEFFDYMRHFFKADATFCGHTHGGQIGFKIPFYGTLTTARIRFKYDVGLFTFPNASHNNSANAYLYVNAGLGVNGLPFRIGMPPEITLIRLTTEQ